jgi:hypothetical protein
MQTHFTIAIHLNRSDRAEVPEGWLADAELVFDDGDLRGLSLAGFVVRHAPTPHPQRQSTASPGVNVEGDIEIAFPSRTYTARGSKVRHFQMLRATHDAARGREHEAKLAREIYAAYRTAVTEQRPAFDDRDS